MTHRELVVHCGRDRRRVFSRQRPESTFRNDWPVGVSSLPQSDASQLLPAPYSIAFPVQPYVITDPPYSTDDNGQSFAGCVFVCVSVEWQGVNGILNGLRGPGNITNPLVNVGVPAFPASTGNPNDLMYAAYGIPPGATMVMSGKATPSNTNIPELSQSFSPTSTFFLYELPRFSLTGSDTGAEVTITWSGGTPIQETVVEQNSMNFEFGCAAVPATLPAGYTPAPDTTDHREPNLEGVGMASCGDYRRLRAIPNKTYANMGFGSDLYPTGAQSDIVWVSGVPYQHQWGPQAYGRAVSNVATNYVSGFGGGSNALPPATGYRYVGVSFDYQKFTADPNAGDVVSYSVVQDGVTVASGTATGAAIKTMPPITVATTLPAPGVNTTLTVNVSGTLGGGSPGAYRIGMTLTASPRTDVPFPFTCYGAGNLIAPGGIATSLLAQPFNSQPLTWLTPGATSYMLAAPGNLGYRPATKGWYQVLDNGTPLAGVGEDEFGWLHKRTVARSSAAGRPFYVPVPGPSGGNQVLTSYAPPSPTAIAMGGTGITLATDSFGAWCSIALPSAGSWVISIAAGTIEGCGMVVDLSLSDPTVTTPDQSLTWEPYRELSTTVGGTFGAIASTPPGAPSNYDSYIVGANPTGAWAGHANDVAVWDHGVGAWQFSTPMGGDTYSSVIPNHAAYWFDGTNWHSNGTDAQLRIPVTTTGAQTVYLFVQPFDHAMAVPGTATISWKAA